MNKPLIFISHINEEKEVALQLKELMRASFLGMIDVFVSADYASVSLGRKWLDEITNSLKTCSVEVVICSPVSIERQWINFEAGAGWVRDIPVIPLCHSGMEPAELPIPLKLLQAGGITEESVLNGLFRVVAGVIGADVPVVVFSDFIDKVKKFELSYLDTNKLQDKPYVKNPAEPNELELSEEAKQLLVEMSNDPKGILMALENPDDMLMNTNGKGFAGLNDPRKRAVWKDAIYQLEKNRLIERKSNTKYSMTSKGYRVADNLKSLEPGLLTSNSLLTENTKPIGKSRVL
ncbi:MAG: toll/interleukin-1 receptor domain-containing protein [Flavobacteriales bacterium]|nr:toll/interleukin-1 receptor domain-containing protein [Flavobacteriales bacterium]